MKKHLQRILALLCVLAMTFGTAGALAEEQTETRIIVIQWQDSNNYDGLRPDALPVSLAGVDANPVPSEANGWTSQVSVPASTAEDAWVIGAELSGYECTPDYGKTTTLILSHAVRPTVSVAGTVVWEDSDNIGKIRPESVQLMLLADGEPYGEPKTVKGPAWKATWDNLPAREPQGTEDIVYTVKQLRDPDGYTVTESGLTVTNTLQLSGLKLSASVSGAPEGTDLSKLSLTVDGPDPSMPRTIFWDKLSGGSYDFGQVLPGAYLVRGSNADALAEGYVMDTANSKVCDAVYVKAGDTGTLEYKYAWKLPEAIDEVDEDYDPMAGIGALTFEILGPDDRMPMTIQYSQFNEKGQYTLDGLVPGVYTVVERNAETLVKYYTLTGASLTGMVMTVEPDGSSTVKLFNQYTPAPTPEPDAEFVDIPVTKTWNDNNDKDGNRPDSVTVRLYADGVEVDSHVLTAAEGWAFTFVEKPRYQDDNKTEIVYSVNEDAVAMYAATINGYNIINTYQPEVTSISVSKIWDDKNDEAKKRPESIAMTLSDGQRVVKVVILNEANGWTATVTNLPTVVNGVPVQYAWKEQSVIGYQLTGVQQVGAAMVFTNTIWERPDEPEAGKKPKTTGDTWYVFEEYDTPLGMEVIINHVGDCFD